MYVFSHQTSHLYRSLDLTIMVFYMYYLKNGEEPDEALEEFDF